MASEEDQRGVAYDAQIMKLRSEIQDLGLQIDKEKAKWVT